MKVSDEIVVNIEKLSNLGFGIAKYEGLVIFVENACPGDKLKVKINKLTKNYANAQIVEVIESSAYRVEPFCALQKVCGGCQLQFIDYNYQLQLKKQIVEDAIKTIGGINVEIREPIPSPEIKQYRHKIQYPIEQTKVSKRILAGYYKPKSHEIVNIKHCPIQPEICDKIIDFIRNTAFNYEISGYNEKKHSGHLRHVVIRVSKSTGKVLVTLVVNATKTFDRLKKFAKSIHDNFKEISGVCVNFNSKKTNVILGEKTELIEGKDFIEEKILNKTFKIGPKTFFQINPKSAENIFAFVKEYIKNSLNKTGQRESRLGLPTQQQKTDIISNTLSIVLDAYAGVSAFGITVSDVCKKVISVEENPEAVEFAKEAIKLNGIKNVELHNMDTQEFFEKIIKKYPSSGFQPSSPARGEETAPSSFTEGSKCVSNSRATSSPLTGEEEVLGELESLRNPGEGYYFDAIILDPPRKGCSEESLNYSLKLCKGKIIYVSCNPATLARDLKYLTTKGARVEFIQPFDMFCHTYHIESIAIIDTSF